RCVVSAAASVCVSVCSVLYRVHGFVASDCVLMRLCAVFVYDPKNINQTVIQYPLGYTFDDLNTYGEYGLCFHLFVFVFCLCSFCVSSACLCLRVFCLPVFLD